mgnify:CR=1 FL=1
MVESKGMAPKVLIVDDDPLVRELASDLVSEAGLEPVTVATGDEALDAVKAHRPALVVLDVMLPGTDGLTLCKAIKSDPQFKGIKVAVTTGRTFKGEKERAMRCGADLYLQKPYDSAAFIGLIRRLLE